MKNILLFLILCGVLFADTIELQPLMAFKAIVYESGDADCSIDVFPDGNVRYFDDSLQGEQNLELQLLDQSGSLLSSYHIPIFFNDPAAGENVKMDYAGVSIRVPYDPYASMVQLVDDKGEIICGIIRSSNAPVVEVIQPAHNNNWDQVSYISWSASDADGDSLLFDIFVADNSGSGWKMIASDVSGINYKLTKAVEATRVMVMANDGFNSNYGMSESSHAVDYIYDTVEVGNEGVVGLPPDEEPQDFSFMDGAVVNEDLTPRRPDDFDNCCSFGPVLLILLGLFVIRR